MWQLQLQLQRDKAKKDHRLKQKVLKNYLSSRLFFVHFVMADSSKTFPEVKVLDSSRCWKMRTTRRQKLQIYQVARSCAQPTYIYYIHTSKSLTLWNPIRSSYIEPLIWKKYVKVVRLKIAKNTSYRKYCADGEEKKTRFMTLNKMT